GGLVGLLSGGTVQSSFWNTTTGPAGGMGMYGGGTFGGTGLTTAQMQNLPTYATTYAGWDFATVWVPPNQAGQGGSATANYPTFY
ncbi:hypothetical protein, partial [Klebsiella pneumoniae]|uniref:hypothetical protein n=1 Tax=Klebsiella pneumoniae TaxID=573 RepID=UPI0019541ED9